MAVLHPRYHYRAALYFNYKFYGPGGKFHNAKRHAASSVRDAKRINKKYRKWGH